MTIRRVASLDQTDPQALSSRFFTSLIMGNVAGRVTMNDFQIPTPIRCYETFSNNCLIIIIILSYRSFEKNFIILIAQFFSFHVNLCRETDFIRIPEIYISHARYRYSEFG
jgi:hypothetical protein